MMKMKRYEFNLLALSAFALLSASTSTYATDIITEINHQSLTGDKSFMRELKEKISLGYFVNLSGPTIANPAASYSYNRFNSGKDSNGYRLDPKSNQEVFNSFSISYKVNNNLSLSYSYSFINSITTNTDYTYKQQGWMVDDKGNAIFDTSGYQKWGVMNKRATRNNSQAFLNQRINAFIPSVYQNNKLGLSMGISYEMPTTEIAKANQMLYGIVVAPTLYFKTSNIKHAYGVSSTFQKDVYKENIFQACENCIPLEMRTFTANIMPYYNYSLSDKLSLMSRLTFDYDQQGSQSGNEFGNNMDNVARLGLGYTINKNISSSIYIEGDMEEPRSDRAFIGATLGIKL
jgi:hypothetical protein